MTGTHNIMCVTAFRYDVMSMYIVWYYCVGTLASFCRIIVSVTVIAVLLSQRVLAKQTATPDQ